ncbi:hypothetical protein GOBAR_AA03334 [Gossypium barbadense]|uniref:SWIM-type domain-containing protein n=1 Tax=Gossypium barbadense TaxID=3634 RepID=A0A2P5YNU6_GOSBA|nr:hypothetical protein GOBAR_AA03334 [Gossypium barbadense]
MDGEDGCDNNGHSDHEVEGYSDPNLDKRDNVLPTMSTSEGTFYVAHDDRSDNESDADPHQEASPDGAEVALFSEPEPVPTIPEDVEGGSDDDEEDPRFKAYSPPAQMHNVDLFQDNALKFPDLPYKRRDRTSSLLDSGELEVGKEFSNKDSFLGVLKQHSIMNGVNYNVVKSKSYKFEAKCAVQDDACSWKIMASLRKKIGLWEIKKVQRCFGRSSQDKFRYVSYLNTTDNEGRSQNFNVDLNCQYSYPVERAASYKGQMQGGRVWCTKVLQEINKAKAQANTMHTTCHDRDNLWFHVTEFDRPHKGIIGGQYRVHFRNRTCDCGRFDALRYPCAHIITACQSLRLDPMSYVDEVYKLETTYNVWRHVFLPVSNERKWPLASLAPFKLLPDRELRRKPKGRPCSTRILDQLLAGVVVPPTGDLVVGVGRVTHLDRIMIAAVFASPMAEVFESRKVMGIGRKKSSLMVPRVILHAMAAYRSKVDLE